MQTSSNEQLLKKYLDNDCTVEEAKSVISWLSTQEGKNVAKKQFDVDIVDIDSIISKIPKGKVRSIKMFQHVVRNIGFEEKGRKIKLHYQNWLKVAAAILIPLLIINSILWVVLQKTGLENEWQEVYVPKGEKLQMMFQDGTKVWLNSDTKLEYPLAFKRKNREVKLVGEAYFTVRSNKKRPFNVRLDGMDVKVTGTSFNIKAYDNDSQITTTLDEGQVFLELKENQEGDSFILKPGQQAQFTKLNAELKIFSSEIGQNSSWKNNELLFSNTPIQEVVKILERWYNIEFELEKDLPEYSYTVGFNNEKLEDVLFGLERITPINCELKNGKVIITKRSY